MAAVTLENIRSFSGRHSVPLEPLTLLVGENSSGKTTFLAALSTLLGSKSFPVRPTFNDPPYDLGSYDTIATNRGRGHGRAQHFCLGYADSRDDFEMEARYIRKTGEPVLDVFTVRSNTTKLEVRIDAQTIQGSITYKLPEQEGSIEKDFHVDATKYESFLGSERTSLIMFVMMSLGQQEPHDTAIVNSLIQLLGRMAITDILSVAPVRTKPKRTYDEIRGDFDPEGDHVPLLLDRVLGTTSASKDRETLKPALERFGAASGLFKKVAIKKLGKSSSDPFQVMVYVDNQAFNLTDVGYGVSQALPVVVQSVVSSDARLLLLQQPEIHLHPRAQAALGSLFTELVAAGTRRFVIETHSDFLLDRIRQEVARGSIKAELVEILFFERRNGRSRIHRITLDAAGNITQAPKHYRDFFRREQEALLTRAMI